MVAKTEVHLDMVLQNSLSNNGGKCSCIKNSHVSMTVGEGAEMEVIEISKKVSKVM